MASAPACRRCRCTSGMRSTYERTEHSTTRGPAPCRAGVLRLNGNSKDLFHSRIGHVQLVALCEALRGDTGIEFLDVSFNDATPAARHGDITAATFGDEAAQVLARLLKANLSLRCVSLEGNAVAQQGAEHLATALCSGCLEVLNLASNPIGDKARLLSAPAEFWVCRHPVSSAMRAEHGCMQGL